MTIEEIFTEADFEAGTANYKMKWSFPSNSNGDISGISHSGIETFPGMKSFAREICQNSLDAAIEDRTVEVEFKPFGLDFSEMPDSDSLKKAFSASLEFWSPQTEKKAQDFFERGINMMDSGFIPFLRVSDFNTTGLLGSNKEYNSPWCNLTKSSGVSDRAGTSGGSFGIGKFASFACSDLRTVFYSTLDIQDITAFQGISRITSFRRVDFEDSEDDDITAGVGFYGAENNRPMHTQLNLDSSFSRKINQTGTDIFIAGFKHHSADWKTDIICSVLDGFLYAVFRGSLVVRVDEVVISKETLPVLIKKYQTSFTENADKYYTVLTSVDTKWYDTNFRNNGKISLGLIVQQDMHRKVAMIRKTGMKIMDRGSITGSIPFAGVMLIQGDSINDFLKKIENPQHNKWEEDRASDKASAQLFLRELFGYIKDRLNELKQEDSSEEIDPGVGEYLPDETDQDFISNPKPSEAMLDTIRAVETTVVPKPSQKDIVQDGSGVTADDEYVDITGPSEHRKTLTGDGAVSFRSVCLDKSKGEYSLICFPAVSVENGELALYISGESHNYPTVIKSVVAIGQAPITFNNNRIYGLTFTADTPVRFKVAIDYYDYCSMEVKAYGNKKG